MIWIILGIIIAIWMYIKNNDPFKSRWELFRNILMWSCILFLPSFIYSMIYSARNDNLKWRVTSYQKIETLANNTSIEGNFFIIQEQMYYFYLISTKDGYKFEKINANNVYIKERKKEEPNIVTMVTYSDNNKWLFIEIPEVKTIITIPPNSIWKGFSIDLRR